MLRISTEQIYDSFIRQSSIQQNNLQSTQERIQTGKKNDLSGIDLAKSIELRAEQQKNDGYLDSMNFVESRLGIQETALKTIKNDLDEMKTISIQASSESYNDPEGFSITLTRLRDTIISIVNTVDSNGEYIFAGVSGDSIKPFEEETGVYNGSDSSRNIRISDSSLIPLGGTGNELFEPDFFDSINNAIDSGTPPTSFLEDLDNALEKIGLVQTGIGSSMNVIQSEREINREKDLSIQKTIMKTEDVDLTEEFSKLIFQQTSYQASMQAFVQARSLSLFNFMK